jgi:hypothetical protein
MDLISFLVTSAVFGWALAAIMLFRATFAYKKGYESGARDSIKVCRLAGCDAAGQEQGQ